MEEVKVATSNVENKDPKIEQNANGSYQGIFLAPVNMLERLKGVLTKMAETDELLANAIKEGKKTFEGCNRYISNNMSDLARKMKQRELVMDDDSVHTLARWYMVNPDVKDVQNTQIAVDYVARAKAKVAEKTAEKKSTKCIPLTAQMGGLFSEDDFK